MSKTDLIDAIKQATHTTIYAVFWSDYHHPEFWDEYETKRDAIRAGIKKPNCLVEFYKDQDTEYRTEYMHAQGERQALLRLYKMLCV